jgi:hypothetical protein
MKKLLLPIALLFITAACDQTSPQSSSMMKDGGMMQSGSMCEKCPCCQRMMEGGMKGGMMMKEGMQCPMMKNGAKDGKSCGCCEGMMKDGMNMKSSPAPKTTSDADHKAHHPQQ